MRKRRSDARRLIYTVGPLLLTLFVGVGAMAEYGLVSFEWFVLFIVGGWIASLAIAGAIAAHISYDLQHAKRLMMRRRRRRRAQREAAAREPAKFNDRLANYLHRTEAAPEPGPRYQSKMPFWCRTDVFTRIGPMSRQQIRELLDRIRRAVHPRQNGHG